MRCHTTYDRNNCVVSSAHEHSVGQSSSPTNIQNCVYIWQEIKASYNKPTAARRRNKFLCPSFVGKTFDIQYHKFGEGARPKITTKLYTFSFIYLSLFKNMYVHIYIYFSQLTFLYFAVINLLFKYNYSQMSMICNETNNCCHYCWYICQHVHICERRRLPKIVCWRDVSMPQAELSTCVFF